MSFGAFCGIQRNPWLSLRRLCSRVTLRGKQLER
jgi:hypothetical protein